MSLKPSNDRGHESIWKGYDLPEALRAIERTSVQGGFAAHLKAQPWEAGVSELGYTFDPKISIGQYGQPLIERGELGDVQLSSGLIKTSSVNIIADDGSVLRGLSPSLLTQDQDGLRYNGRPITVVAALNPDRMRLIGDDIFVRFTDDLRGGVQDQSVFSADLAGLMNIAAQNPTCGSAVRTDELAQLMERQSSGGSTERQFVALKNDSKETGWQISPTGDRIRRSDGAFYEVLIGEKGTTTIVNEPSNPSTFVGIVFDKTCPSVTDSKNNPISRASITNLQNNQWSITFGTDGQVSVSKGGGEPFSLYVSIIFSKEPDIKGYDVLLSASPPDEIRLITYKDAVAAYLSNNRSE